MMQTITQETTAQQLKAQLRIQRDSMEENHAIRLHRALSWMLAAEQYDEDDDIAFITLWIAFNACYHIEHDDRELSERASFKCFIEQLVKGEGCQRLYDLLWHNYSGFVRGVVENQYLFATFWRAQREPDVDWQKRFESSKSAARHALANQLLEQLLAQVLDRLYVLRNQLVHGGATYASMLNREQLKSSRRLMAELMPVIVSVMLAEQSHDWGEIAYAPVKS